MFFRTLVLVVAVFVGPFVLAQDNSLVELVNERLTYMDDVAAYKWINKLPIEDLAREQLVLEQAILAGLSSGIRAATSRDFFSAQIDAAKEIQRYWFDQWSSNSAPSSAPSVAPNLAKSVRPKLLQIGNAITKKLGVDEPAQANFLDSIDIEGLSAEGELKLFQALSNIRFYDDRLQQILDSGILRVGTTGDYAPFSYRFLGEISYRGIDIDLASDLAKALGVKLLFVHTSWPSLMDDLQSGSYDIGMSGISRNLNRQKFGYFSIPYHSGGKTPIALCENVSKFNTLNKIDKVSTEIIVNPGGTNERFVDKNILHAKKILHPDNRTIFQEIIDGRADLMITDNIEVRLKSAQHPSLCATMPGHNLTYLDKAYLMPQDQPLKEYVDTWLALRTADATLSSTFQRHLDAHH
ncbi:MAG: gamma subclass chorismate mutase AroQ [Pseudomonadales bacterium]